jgi:hypothetical protein
MDSRYPSFKNKNNLNPFVFLCFGIKPLAKAIGNETIMEINSEILLNNFHNLPPRHIVCKKYNKMEEGELPQNAGSLLQSHQP